MSNNYNAKYVLTVDKKDKSKVNPFHSEFNGKIISIIDLEVGERGWLAYKDEDSYLENYWHRIHTSTIKDIEVDSEGNIKIETNNSFYYLKLT